MNTADRGTAAEQPAFLGVSAGGIVKTIGTLSCALGHRVGTSGDGAFAEWAWNGQRLVVHNDRFGFYPLYVYSKDGSFGVSPSIAALIGLGADTTFDYPALAVALRLGQFIGEDTPFRYIRALPPNTTLEWDGLSTTSSGGYGFVREKKYGRDEAVAIYNELFRRAIQRRAPLDANFCVPLSGGRDSRHILLELVRNGCRPAFCLTAKTVPEDVRVAALLCETLGLQHVVVEQPSAPYAAEAEKNRVTSFGLDQGAYQIAIRDCMQNRGVTAIYDGLAGDVLSAGLFLEPDLHRLFLERRSEEIADRLLITHPEPVLQRVLDPEFFGVCSRAAALERAAAEVVRHFDAHNPTTSYFFWNRTRRKIALTTFAVFSGIRHAYVPYVDHELYDFLASLPAELIVSHTFHTEAIHRAYPEYAHVPFEDKKARQYDFSALHARFARDFSSAAAFRPTKLLRNGSLNVRLLLSRLSSSFGAANFWFLHRASWVYQLEMLASGGAAHLRGHTSVSAGVG